MTSPTIATASASDEAAVLAVLVLAFGSDPATRWTWPAPDEYLRHFPVFARILGGKAFSHGSAYYADGYGGGALWLPPGVHPDEGALAEVMQSSSAAPPEDVSALFEQMERHHPQEPHWYLPFIGVDPSHQGEGYGGALMTHALMACDRDHTPAYLESSNPKNVPLYERHGFDLLGTIRVGESPPIFPMLRRPR
ncbi:GNAT family N-acetyltransferase [Microbacterium yannicii]|uniref:GNAT family N-acetyltransferase n=1 Tax=Microbacterium yannicii TaxID=671622 RepID=UPI0002D75F08|nr:GNAT family N-acetyltransferase [Microbacterium yannicii]